MSVPTLSSVESAPAPDWADELAAEIVGDVLESRQIGVTLKLTAARLRLLRAEGEGRGLDRAKEAIAGMAS